MRSLESLDQTLCSPVSTRSITPVLHNSIMVIKPSKDLYNTCRIDVNSFRTYIYRTDMEATVLRTEGEIVARTEGDKIIARFAEEVETGVKIIDNRGQGFGQVNEIFGPVDDPYVEIQMADDRSLRHSMLDKKIYTED